MQPTETMFLPPYVRKAEIRWKRIIAAAFLSEITVIATMLATMAVYSLAIAPPQTQADFQALGEHIGYYVAPPAGALATFLWVLWVCGRVRSSFKLNGTLVGVVSAFLILGFLAGATPHDRPMYIAAFVLRIAAGYAGGFVAAKRSSRP